MSSQNKNSRSVLLLAITPKAKPDKDELVLILFYFKQIFALAIGLSLGVLQIQGF